MSLVKVQLQSTDLYEIHSFSSHRGPLQLHQDHGSFEPKLLAWNQPPTRLQHSALWTCRFSLMHFQHGTLHHHILGELITPYHPETFLRSSLQLQSKTLHAFLFFLKAPPTWSGPTSFKNAAPKLWNNLPDSSVSWRLISFQNPLSLSIFCKAPSACFFSLKTRSECSAMQMSSGHWHSQKNWPTYGLFDWPWPWKNALHL